MIKKNKLRISSIRAIYYYPVSTFSVYWIKD